MGGIDRSRMPRLAGLSVQSAAGGGLDGFERGLREGLCGIRGVMDGWPVALLAESPSGVKGNGDCLAGFLEGIAAAAITRSGADPAVLGDPGTLVVVSSTKGDISGLAGPAGETSLGPFVGRIARRFGLSGHSELVSCACASGGIAVARAVRLLQSGWGTRALVLGFEMLNRFLVSGFASLGALSPRAARPFDQERDGLSLGEGVAAVWLVMDEKPGVRITGTGQTCDASGLIRPLEDGSGLALAMDRALEMAGPRPVDALCGHGTGTVANDSMEAAAYGSRYGTAVPPVFGIKGATGHTMGCCGVTEVVACTLAIQGGFLPGTVGFESGKEDLDVVKVTRQAVPERILSLNSGFGGINVALVIDRDD